MPSRGQSASASKQKALHQEEADRCVAAGNSRFPECASLCSQFEGQNDTMVDVLDERVNLLASLTRDVHRQAVRGNQILNRTVRSFVRSFVAPEADSGRVTRCTRAARRHGRHERAVWRHHAPHEQHDAGRRLEEQLLHRAGALCALLPPLLGNVAQIDKMTNVSQQRAFRRSQIAWLNLQLHWKPLDQLRGTQKIIMWNTTTHTPCP